MVRPLTVALVSGGLPDTWVVVWATPARYGVTVYRVMGLPPLAGAVQLTVAEALPAVAVTPVGAAGAVGATGVTAPDGAEAGPLPTPLVAVTMKVYAVPLVRPVTLAVVCGGVPLTTAGVCATPAMYGVIVYEVIGLPPLDGAVQETTADWFPAVAVTLAGAPGRAGGGWVPDSNTTVDYLPLGAGTGADAGRRGGTGPDHLVLREDLHVTGIGKIRPGHVTGPRGQGVTESRVGVEPDRESLAALVAAVAPEDTVAAVVVVPDAVAT